MLYVALSPGKGRGVFTDSFITCNTMVNTTYSWLLTKSDVELYDRTSVSGHWFDCSEGGLIPLGYAALLNDSSTPNCVLRWRRTELGYVGELTTTRDIQPGEELFINYMDP